MQSERDRSPQRIEISVLDQQLFLFEGPEQVAAFPISTSKFGIGSQEGSYRTPLGSFVIDEMIGGDAPERTIFRSRKPEGIWDPEETHEDAPSGDLVLSRILWLHGLEEGNANTKERYIYIHGTNHEDLIGTPESQGCVRMTNADVIALFDQVEIGTSVEIA